MVCHTPSQLVNGNAPFFKPLLTPFPHRKWVDTTIPSGWECSVFVSLSRIQLILQDGWLDKLYSLVISLCLSVPFSYSSLVSLVNPCSVMIFLITICGVNSLLPFDFLEWWRLLHPCFLARRCCQWPYKITHYLWILFSFSLFFGVKESGKRKFLVC